MVSMTTEAREVVSTQHEMTEREREVGALETVIIEAWIANDGRLPEATLVALLVGAKTACDAVLTDPEGRADRALARLRKAAEAAKIASLRSSGEGGE